MSENLCVSVVIPCFNAEKTLELCVESVVQELDDNALTYEIILVNDGSNDSTLKICESLACNNHNIRIISQENSGPSVARNNGIRVANGKYIALNDSDDKWIPGKLKIQLEELESNPDVDLICAKYGNCRRRAEKRQEVSFNREVFHNFFSPQTSVFRREALVCGNIKFPENQKYSEDMHFFLDFMRHGKCVYIPFLATVPVFPKKVFGEAGLSSHIWKMELGELKNIVFARKIKKISAFIMCAALLWSLAKFCRRAVIFIFIKIRFFINARKLYE